MSFAAAKAMVEIWERSPHSARKVRVKASDSRERQHWRKGRPRISKKNGACAATDQNFFCLELSSCGSIGSDSK